MRRGDSDTGYIENEYLDDDESMFSTIYYGENMFINSAPNNKDVWNFHVYTYNSIEELHNDTAKFYRISMTEPKFLGLEYEEKAIEKKYINKLIEVLNSRPKEDNIAYIDRLFKLQSSPITIWQLIIKETNQQSNYCYNNYSLDRFIPIDLPMPDYTLLPTTD